MDRFWKYGVALLLGVWFFICNHCGNTTIAYNLNATYNWPAGIIKKHSRFCEVSPTFSHGKGTRQVHHTTKRFLKENEVFILDTPIFFSLAPVPLLTQSRFATFKEFYLSSSHRLNSSRGPPQC